ncbi:MAG: diguanylate cyclase domain-containing protein [Acidimicrobiia bacterium]
MDGDRILDLLRPLVLVVDGVGTVLDWRGGHGGFHGYTRDDFVGASVFDFVAPDQHDELALYFLEATGRSAETLELPMPFRLTILDTDGRRHNVDIVPTGDSTGEDHRWIVVVVPDELHTAVARSLEAEMAGAPREEVKRLLTEELRVDNTHYRTRWFLVDLTVPSGPTVTTAREDDEPLAEAVAAEIATGWRPWGTLDPGAIESVLADDLPGQVRARFDERGWHRCAVVPVHVDGSLVAAYLLFGRVPDEEEVAKVDPNVAARIHRLVDATALLIARWQDRDRLVAAATRDPLTGLANRDSFADALAGAHDGSSVLYVDVDRFKDVNDRYGHQVGDRVLVEIARRIASACRPSDVVARFGGDEFVVLLNGVSPELAREIGDRILRTMDEPIPELAEPDRVSVSVGLATVDDGDALVTADQAMLQAKRAGRGRLIGADELPG